MTPTHARHRRRPQMSVLANDASALPVPRELVVCVCACKDVEGIVGSQRHSLHLEFYKSTVADTVFWVRSNKKCSRSRNNACLRLFTIFNISRCRARTLHGHISSFVSRAAWTPARESSTGCWRNPIPLNVQPRAKLWARTQLAHAKKLRCGQPWSRMCLTSFRDTGARARVGRACMRWELRSG